MAEPLASGKTYFTNGTKYIYLKRDAVEALDADEGDEVLVYAEDDHLRVETEDGSLATRVECVYCSEEVLNDRIGKHHFDEHPDRRYDPVWYMEEKDGGDTDGE